MKLIEIINQDIGNTDNSLGEFKKLRIEFYNEDYLSIFDQYNPKYIYFVSIPQWNHFEPETYKFEIIQEEVPEADFVRLEAK